MRPTIRIEIQNNLAESMEVDENEEGELSDEDQNDSSQSSKTQQTPKSSTAFPMEPLFDPEKLSERARRFQLPPSETFAPSDLRLLYASLGIAPTDSSNVRFEVIHMRGIDQMSASDILEYFLEYAPVSVEWVDDETCNVAYADRVAAARALHFISKAVRGMPVRDDRGYFDPDNDQGQSVLVLNKDREVQITHDDDNELLKELNEANSVDILEISAKIPPGYWRLGKKHPKFGCILLRYALKTDKQPIKSEALDKYYKEQGKAAPKGRKDGIFGRNKHLGARSSTQGKPGNAQKEPLSEPCPWSTLAENWDEDAQFREQERRNETETIAIKNPNLRVRLGEKRKENENEEKSAKEDDEMLELVTKKSKVPRMRMYADEEEEKIKRRKIMTKINQVFKKIEDPKSTDLRKVLKSRSYVNRKEREPEVVDLGSKLKNRSHKMVFEIETEARGPRPPSRFLNRLQMRPRRESDDETDDYDTSRARTRNRRPDPSYYESEEEKEEDQNWGSRTKSKVAVVIKTQKKPTVASAIGSTVWSRVGTEKDAKKRKESESESRSEPEEESSSEEERPIERIPPKNRPGFSSGSKDANEKKKLKIEINNDHFRK